jgi:hypothetical protein
MPNILDPKFKYVPAARTSVAETFKRVRKQMAEDAKRLEAEKLERISKVRVIGSGK